MSSIRMSKEGRRRVGERKEIFPNANKFSTKRELAMKWLHNIGTGHNCGIIKFQPENGLPGPCHRLSGTQVAVIG